MRQKHIFYELAKNRLVQKLTRIMGAYRLGNITLKKALEQSEVAFIKAMREINRYTFEVQAKRDLGSAFKPLSSENMQQLKREIMVKQEQFRLVLMDAKT
jgi:hypothetical protein